jgi:hypothetical protein
MKQPPLPTLALSGLLILGISTLTASAGRATEGPWCHDDHSGNIVTCSHPSHEECLQTIRGLGGTCLPNPNYRPPASRKSKQRSDSKR